jgi:hypothetical protein
LNADIGYEAPTLVVIGSVAELTLAGDGCMFDKAQKNLAWSRDDMFWFLKDCPTGLS